MAMRTARSFDIGNLAACRIRVAGRIDGYAKVGNPLEGNPFVHCPTFDWQVSGAELLQAGSMRLELGGSELFLAIERIADGELRATSAARCTSSRAMGPMASAPCISTAARATTQRSGPRRCSSPRVAPASPSLTRNKH